MSANFNAGKKGNKFENLRIFSEISSHKLCAIFMVTQRKIIFASPKWFSQYSPHWNGSCTRGPKGHFRRQTSSRLVIFLATIFLLFLVSCVFEFFYRFFRVLRLWRHETIKMAILIAVSRARFWRIAFFGIFFDIFVAGGLIAWISATRVSSR